MDDLPFWWSTGVVVVFNLIRKPSSFLCRATWNKPRTAKPCGPVVGWGGGRGRWPQSKHNLCLKMKTKFAHVNICMCVCVLVLGVWEVCVDYIRANFPVKRNKLSRSLQKSHRRGHKVDNGVIDKAFHFPLGHSTKKSYNRGKMCLFRKCHRYPFPLPPMTLWGTIDY